MELVLFTYQISYNDEKRMQIYFNDYNDEINKFSRFELPDGLTSKDGRLKNILKNKYIFYYNKKTNNFEYKIFQKYLSGNPRYHESRLIDPNKSYLLDLKFEDHMEAKPCGNQYERNVDKLIMISSFILLENFDRSKFTNRLILLGDFKKIYEQLIYFNDQNEVNDYVMYLLECLFSYLTRTGIVFNVEMSLDDKNLYICCCLGFIGFDLKNLDKKDFETQRNSISKFLSGFKLAVIQKNFVNSNDNVRSCFESGISYLIYACLNNSYLIKTHLQNLLKTIILYYDDSEIIDSISKNLIGFNYFCSLNETELSGIQILKNENVANKFINLLLDTCNSFQVFLFIILPLIDDQNIKSIITEKNKIIKDRFLKSSKEPLSNFVQFHKFKHLFNSDFRIEIH